MDDQPSAEIDDIDIAIKVLDDREAGCRMLLEVHGGWITAILRRDFGDLLDCDEIESVLGEATLAVLESIENDTFDSTRPLRPWYRTIAKNAACNRIRSASQNPNVRIEFDPPHDARQPGIIDDDEDPRKTELLEALAQEVERLPTERRKVVKAWLVAQGGSSENNTDLAKRLGKTVGNFSSTLRQAQQDLQRRLEERGYSYP